MNKSEVYFNEYNVMSGKTVYFPLVSGILQSHAQKNPKIAANYEFKPFIFARDSLENILGQYQEPSIAAFSSSMWNINLSLSVAENLKKRFPNCLTVFGGPQIPFAAEDFFKEHPFVDVTVRGEGEKIFEELLLKFPNKDAFVEIPGISFRNNKGSYVRNHAEMPLEKNLNNFPSPYLTGVFKDIMHANPDVKFQAIVETNRGCPYACSYCSWGQGGLSKKFRFFDLDRVKDIANWCGENKIEYVFCADSNFGMFERDLEIAKFFVDAKLKNKGYPEKFRVCYAKNAPDTVFQIGKTLHKQDMEKGLTLARQSNNPQALANVGRKNIKMSVFNELQKKYNQEGIPTYTELILGLPGETYQSFAKGIEEILSSGIQNQLFVYHCQVYPNTELGDKKYQERFGIQTRKIPINEVHGTVRALESTSEYEEVIVATNALPAADWKKSTVLSSTMQLLHGLKAGFHVMNYLSNRHGVAYTDFLDYIIDTAKTTQSPSLLNQQIGHFNESAEAILQGNSRCRVMPEFGNIYWEQEEASFLEIMANKEQFYEDMYHTAEQFLKNRLVKFDNEELKEIVDYQKARMPVYDKIGPFEFTFKFNIPQYFENLSTSGVATLEKKPQIMKLQSPKDYHANKQEFAKEIVLRGRKSNKILYQVNWMDQKN